MFLEFFRFELRYQLKQPLLWLIAVVFGLMAFTATSSDAVTVGSAIGNVWRNAPSTIINLTAAFSLLGMFVIAIFIASAMLRDYELGTADLFFASPAKARDYLLGRFSAGAVACLLISLCISLGLMLGQFMPWIDPRRLGPFSLTPYLWSFAVIVLPNLLFAGALLALLAALTRSLLMVYLGILAFFVLWLIAGAMTRDLDNVWLAVLVDPFGIRAMGRTMRYWAVEERNTQLPQLAGYIIANRALWGVVALAMIGAMLHFFSPTRAGTGKARKRTPVLATASTPGVDAVATPPVAAMRHAPRFDRASAWAMFQRQLRFDLMGVLKSVPFIVMLIFSVLNFTGSVRFIDDLFDTKVYPVTYLMLQALADSSGLFLFLIVVFYAGELIFKERQARLSEVVDALPVPNWVPLAAKCAALIGVVVIFGLVGVLSGIGFQIWRGYTNFELDVYLSSLAIGLVPFVLMGLLSIAVMVYTQNKFVGFLVVILVFVGQTMLGILRYEHNLYNFAGAPIAPYSDMNGFGHYLTGWAWFSGYWALFTLLLLLAASALWARGNVGTLRERGRLALQKLRGPLGVAMAVVAITWIGLGSFIYYNTNVINDYLPGDEALDLQARYEREYAQYKNLKQPRIRAVRATVDLRPEQRSARIVGEYTLANPHAQAISELHILMLRQAELESIDLPGAELLSYDEPLGYRIYRLAEPLQPGAVVKMGFVISGGERGFSNSIAQTQLVENGSFLDSRAFPQFGFEKRGQIVDRNERRKRGLGEVQRMARLEDESARANTYITDDADWIDFATTVCTAPDQIALAPGYLTREYEKDGRRCFDYTMDQPMLPFWAYLSARWQVKRGDWNGLPVEVYYDAAHPYNVDRMIEGVKDSLDYFTTAFTPYQHKQVRIIEFPRYARFAQSFANTIPFSESIGFIADLTAPDAIDYVYYVTAHEVAHQWWAHQVIGADVQGSTVLSESLSQYSALMVMEKKYGRDKIGKFLRYELDNYLSSRGGELVEELPLYRVENQAYIHYRKGSLVFYRLREEIGEDTLNRALKKFLTDKGYQQPPYTTSKELLDYIRAEAGPEHEQLIVDLFEKISFYDNRVVAAKAVKRDDGKYEVALELKAAKRYSDGLGKETDGSMDDWIEVGVFAAPGDDGDGKVLHLERRRITEGEPKLTVVVDEEPFEAGFDPYHKLIDRVPADNRKRVELL